MNVIGKYLKSEFVRRKHKSGTVLLQLPLLIKSVR